MTIGSPFGAGSVDTGALELGADEPLEALDPELPQAAKTVVSAAAVVTVATQRRAVIRPPISTPSPCLRTGRSLSARNRFVNMKKIYKDRIVVVWSDRSPANGRFDIEGECE
jgi:hypothetical protein